MDLTHRPPLPGGYRWGKQSGEYIPVLRGAGRVAMFGGLPCKVLPLDKWPDELAYVIAKGEREIQRSAQAE